MTQETAVGREPSPIVLFDGECNLCNASVQFIIDRDPRGVFRFASQQGRAGRALLARFGSADEVQRSVVLVEGDRLYTRSTAALRIAARLAGPWRLLYAFIVIPRPVRDAVYDWIARNRHRWSGRSPACRIPSAAARGRFLE